jgi:hypothetical protein
MSSVTFLTSLGGDGSTVTDDSSPTTGLDDGGHITRFVPALAQTVVMAQTATTKAAAAALSATDADNAKTLAQAAQTGSIAISLNVPTGLPTLRPSLLLDFANSEQVDPRITFTRASSATRTNKKGIIESIAANVPRIDYNATSSVCKGLLIEESRTNLLTYSAGLTDASWLLTGATMATSAIVAPDNTTMFLLSATGTAECAFYKTATSTAVAHVLSCYVKKGTGLFAVLQLQDGVGNGMRFWFDLTLAVKGSSQAIGSGWTAGSFGIDDVGGGVYRVWSSAVAVGTSVQSAIYSSDADLSTTGATGRTLYAWGAQLEVGNDVTSYIPTTTTAVTRSADITSLTGNNFSSWFKQSEGTFAVSVQTRKESGNAPILVAQISGGADRHQLSALSANANTVNASTVQTSLGNNYSQPVKIAYAFKDNDFALSINGAAVSTDTAGTTPITLTYLMVGKFDFGGQESLNGTISQIIYFQKKLANTELQALTS